VEGRVEVVLERATSEMRVIEQREMVVEERGELEERVIEELVDMVLEGLV
jgi:hypothetical protein